jgi:hypothetical protein
MSRFENGYIMKRMSVISWFFLLCSAGLMLIALGCSSPLLHPATRGLASNGDRPITSAKRVLIVIPHEDFDPTEAAVPWCNAPTKFG